ncbi:nucleotidyl transferase AbiEii/AbiGii toxin family protein, partial [Candidatus Margulisiibacteriota bacterium]
MIREELQTRANAEGLPLKIIEKEALQIYILGEFFSLPESSHFTFQGGTCLRLVYGGVRYSEDLDFVTTAKENDIACLIKKLSSSLGQVGPLFEGRIEILKQKTSETFCR